MPEKKESMLPDSVLDVIRNNANVVMGMDSKTTAEITDEELIKRIEAIKALMPPSLNETRVLAYGYLQKAIDALNNKVPKRVSLATKVVEPIEPLKLDRFLTSPSYFIREMESGRFYIVADDPRYQWEFYRALPEGYGLGSMRTIAVSELNGSRRVVKPWFEEYQTPIRLFRHKNRLGYLVPRKIHI